jgi:hypothetical protein
MLRHVPSHRVGTAMLARCELEEDVWQRLPWFMDHGTVAGVGEK